MADPPKLLSVAHEIKLDHDNVRDLYDRYKAATSKDEKNVLASRLMREIAAHSDAEEVSVYKHFESWGLGNEADYNRGKYRRATYLEEHAKIRRLMQTVIEANITQSNYDQIVNRAVSAFLEHAAKVENEQLMKIEQNATAQQSDNAAKEFLKHRKVSAVPSRP